MALPRMVQLEKEQLEEYWKEQKVVLDHRDLFQFKECIKLQSKILTNFFGVSLEIKEEKVEVVKKEVEVVKKEVEVKKELDFKKGKKGRVRKAEIKPVETIKIEESEDVSLNKTRPRIVDFTSVDEDMDEFAPDLSTISEDNDYGEENKLEIDEKPSESSYMAEDDSIKEEIKLEIKPEPLARFTCTFCQSEEQSYKFLKKHVEDIHLGLRYLCSLCSFNSQDREESRVHMAETHREMNFDHLKFECGICRFQGEIQEHSDHVIMVHPEYCDFLFDDVDDEVTVMEEKYAPITGEMKVEKDDGDRWPCTICGFRAADKHTLRVHVEMNHLQMRFSCTICAFNTKELYIVRGHVVKVHDDDREDYKFLHYECGLCQFRGLKDDFMEHLYSDHQEYSVYYQNSKTGVVPGMSEGAQKGICTFCQQTFSCNLRGHIQTMHFGVNYTCKDQECSHRSKVKKATMEHIEMKHLPGEYKVEDKVGVEGRAWIRKNLVYTCGHCGLQLDRHSELVVHMTSEHQDKIVVNMEFPCKKCVMVFPSRQERKEHNLFHKVPASEDSETKCKNCGYISSTESNLKVHIMMRHMTARFICKTCSKQFKFPSDTRTHIAKFHEKDINTGMDCVCKQCSITYSDYQEFMKHAESTHKMPKGQRGVRRPKSTLTVKEKVPTTGISLSTPEPTLPLVEMFCRFCNFNSTTPGATRVHMDLLHFRTMHSCRQCKINFKMKMDLVKHMRTTHEADFSQSYMAENIMYHCAVCNMATQKDAFLAHMNSHREQETSLGKEEVEEAANYSCTKCPQFQDDKSPTISHIISEHMGEHDESSGITMQEFVSGLLVMNCLYCIFQGSLVDFYSHTDKCLDTMKPLEKAKPQRNFSVPSNENMCVFCGLEVNGSKGIYTHVLFNHLKATQSCGICEIKMKNRPAMAKHIAEQHDEEKSSKIVEIQCGLCSFKSAEGVFTNHMITAHNEEIEMDVGKVFKCNQCNFTAPSPTMVSHHEKLKHEQFKCDHCEEVVVSKKKLSQHYMHNHQDWTFDCNDCGFATKHKTALARHMVTVHEKQRNFSCGYTGCDRNFTRREYLVLHSRKDHADVLTE